MSGLFMIESWRPGISAMARVLVRFLLRMPGIFENMPPPPRLREGLPISGFSRSWPALGCLRLRREVTLIMSILSGSTIGGGGPDMGSK
jgi:hypothetical protein